MRDRTARHHAVRWLAWPLLAVGALALASDARAVAAQDRDCPLKVRPRLGASGYQKRFDQRPRPGWCEGMFVGLQSTPLGLEVVSLVKGKLWYDRNRDQAVYIHVPALPNELTPQGSATVLLQGRGREANLNFALDASAPPDTTLQWSLTHAILPESLNSDRIGVFGQTRTSALSDPVYVPLEVSYSSVRNAAAAPMELVIHIPGASGARWTFASDTTNCSRPEAKTCRNAVQLNADGYFQLEIPPAGSRSSSAAAISVIAVYWRERSRRVFNDRPEYVRILRW